VFLSVDESVANHHLKTRNVDPYVINRRHIGMFGGELDPTRLGLDTNMHFAIIRAAPIFNAIGELIGTADPQNIGGADTNGVIAGAVSTVHDETCVLGFRLHTAEGRATGWVPATYFAHAPEVVAYSKTVARAIDRVRPADVRVQTRKYVVAKRTGVGKWKGLYVFPRETSISCKVHNYFVNRHGTVNLLLNVPTEGSTFWGSPIDVLPIDTEFRRILSVPSEWRLVYPKGSNDPLPARRARLQFVYGYAINAANEKRFGWINRAVLERPEVMQ